jgi:arylsulfatase A-like enzyme
MDWTATMLALGNAKPDPAYPLDGNNLLPVIRGAQPVYERSFFWRTSEMSAALNGPWKYVNDGTQEYLFNLSIDEREQQNFREQNQRMFTRLRDEFRKWDSTVLPRPPARRRG